MKNYFEQEKRNHSSKLIPYSYYGCRLPEDFLNVPIHWHDELELNYIIEGSAIFKVGDREFVSHAGDIILIQPDVIHSIFPDDKNFQVYDTLVFNGDMLGISESDRSCLEYIQPIINRHLIVNELISIYDKGYKDIHSCVIDIFKCAKEHSPLCDILIKGRLYELIWLLIENGHIKKSSYNKSHISDMERLRPVLWFITNNFNKDINISQLAAIVHLSESYFMNYFHKVIGISANEYIVQLRIRAVCSMLRTTNESILNISLECGFHNLSNFNRHFKRLTGYSPSEYRRHSQCEKI